MTGSSGFARRAPGIAVVDRPGRAVVLNLDRLTSQMSPLAIEGTAWAIWTLIDGVHSESDIVAALEVQFPQTARADLAAGVRSFLSDGVARGILAMDGHG